MTLMTLFGSGTHSLTPGSAPHLSFSSVLLLYYTLHPQDAAALTNPNFKSVERTSIKDIKKVRVTRSTLVLRQQVFACQYLHSQSNKRQLPSYRRHFATSTGSATHSGNANGLDRTFGQFDGLLLSNGHRAVIVDDEKNQRRSQ